MNDQEQDLKIKDLENNQSFMAEKLDDIKKTMVSGFDSIKKELKEQRECHTRDLEKIKIENDNKYASKLTEKIVYTLVGFILLAVLGALMSGVI